MCLYCCQSIHLEDKGFQFMLIMIYFLPEQYKYGACHKCIHTNIC